MPSTDKRIDEQIANAPDFAQPIMRHLRTLVHTACPDAEETIKWGRPFFLHNGRMLCAIAAFKQHCGFGFFGPGMSAVMKAAKMPAEDSAGSIGRITSLSDLPPDAQLLAWIRQAAELAASNAPSRAPAKPRADLPVPRELTSALAKSPAAKKQFSSFTPGCRREYAEWITEAKRPETRDRRVAQAVEWIAEGKTRNWKYKNC